MRIGYVVGSFPNRSETFIIREVTALAAEGLEVVVLPLWRCREPARWAGTLPEPARWRISGQLAMVSRPQPGTFWRLYFTRRLLRKPRVAVSALAHLGEAFAMAAWVRDHGLERLHAHFANLPSTVGWVAADVAGRPFTMSVHARDVFVEPQFLAEKAQAALAVVACNSAAADRCREVAGASSSGKIHLIPHGLPLEDYRFRGRHKSDRPLLVASGRLVEKKGFAWLIRALEILRRRHVHLRCWIVGDGPLRKSLAREAERFAVADIVEFKGWLPHGEAVATYRQADAFVAPSVVARDGDRDGLPNTVVEAAALGVPLVTTNVGGLGDLVRDGETGLVAEPGDAASLAARLDEALSDPEAAYRRAEHARAEVEARFDQKATIPALIEILTA